MTNNIIASLKIIEKLFFQRPDFWKGNYLKKENQLRNFFQLTKGFF